MYYKIYLQDRGLRLPQNSGDKFIELLRYFKRDLCNAQVQEEIQRMGVLLNQHRTPLTNVRILEGAIWIERTGRYRNVH
jgi:transposase